MSTESTVDCCDCGGAPVPIVYGYPGVEMIEAERRGEVVLGGCLVWDGGPTRRCPTCGSDSGSVSWNEPGWRRLDAEDL